MSRFAQPGRHPAEKRARGRRFGSVRAVADAPGLGPVLAVTLALALTAPAAAQSNSGIYINNDVLNNLGPGPQAAPLTPYTPSYAPAAPVAPLTPLAPQRGAGNNGLTFQTQGSGNFVVTRPGTLLFPPLQDPTSTLAPGFDSAADQAARKEAFDNAFAEGPEPTSQLLIPLDDDNSVQIFTEQLPPVDSSASRGTAPVLTLHQPPQPAAPKPAVPAEVLAQAQQPAEAATTALAPEFQTPEPQSSAMQSPEAPVMAEMPALAKVEEVAIAPAPVAASETPAGETPAAETPVAQTPAAETPGVQTPAAETARMTAMTAAENNAPGNNAPVSSAPVSSAEVAAPVSAPTTTVAATTSAPTAPQPDSAPVSLLPAGTAATAVDSATNSPVQPTATPPATPNSGLQTASLTVNAAVEDVSFIFEAESAELSELAQSELRSLADSLRGSDDSRVQVLGFASAEGSSEDMARKLALSRALKVRTFLIDAGVPSTRIQVRSLGDKADGGPANRVDIRPIDS